MFKRISVFAVVALFAVSCNQSSDKTTSENAKDSTKVEYFGAKITEENALPGDSVVSILKNSTEDVPSIKATGKIDAVCEKKGCWMSLITNSGEKIRVTFKDYGFFVPTSGCDGKTAIVDGKASKKLISVQMLKEYAKDDGKSKVEIDSIKSPSYEYSFEATGVIIK
jgi:PBP1b-binding outer membrane lipoprotein LpoB